MKNTTETPDLLENLDDELKPIWDEYQKGKLKSSIGYFIGMVVLTIILFKFYSLSDSFNLIKGVLSPPPGEGLIESMIKGPVKFLEFFGGIAGVLMNIGVPIAALYHLFNVFADYFSVKKKTYPQAPISPEKTIVQFFSNVFQEEEYVQPYVCLLNKTKNDYGGYFEFVKFWSNKKREVLKTINELYPRSNQSEMTSNMETSTWNIGNIEKVDAKNTEATAKVSFTISTNIVENLSSPSHQSLSIALGGVNINSSISLEKIGERWYINNKNWDYAIDYKDRLIPLLKNTFIKWKAGELTKAANSFSAISKDYNQNQFVRHWNFELFNKFISVKQPDKDEYIERINIDVRSSYLMTNKRIYIIHDEDKYQFSYDDIANIEVKKSLLLFTVIITTKNGEEVKIKDFSEVDFIQSIDLPSNEDE